VIGLLLEQALTPAITRTDAVASSWVADSGVPQVMSAGLAQVITGVALPTVTGCCAWVAAA